MTELLLGTKKGLFALEGPPGGPFEVTARAFAGEPVEYAMRDPASGRVIASVTSPFYGPKLWRAADPAGEWEQAEGVALPDGGEQALERIWAIVAGEDGVLYAGGDPGRAVREPRRGRELVARALAVGPPDPARVAARRRRAVPALDRARGRASRRSSRWRCRRSASGSPTTTSRPGATATTASTPATCPRTRRPRSPTASTTSSAPAAGPSGCSCSSTAASTAPTTRARHGPRSATACPRTSASRWRSTRPTRTAPT